MAMLQAAGSIGAAIQRGSHGQQYLGDLKGSYRNSSLLKNALTSLQGKAQRREVPMQSNMDEVGLEDLLKPHLT